MATQDRWIFRRGLLWVADLTQRNASPRSARVPAHIRQIQPDTLPGLVSAAGQMDRIAPDALGKRFDIGRRCFAAWVEDSIAAYGWVTCGSEWVGEFERELNVQPGEAYIWDCATLPDFRRQRLFSALLSHVAYELHREGLERLWIIGLLAAPPIVRSIEAAGFELISQLTYVRLLNKRLLLTTPPKGASSEQVEAARRLLKGKDDHVIGPLLAGNFSHFRPPDTHLDR